MTKLIKKLSLFAILILGTTGAAFAEVSEETAYIFNTFSFRFVSFFSVLAVFGILSHR